MNILQLVPKLNVGGVEKGTVEVARYLVLKGHKAVVVSGGGVFEKKLAAVGARHYNLPVGRKDPVGMIYSYFKLCQIIRKENIDIIHARSRIPALAGYFAAGSTGRVFITTAHGQYKRHLISRVMGWGKVVIVANETMARYMKENFGVPFRKTVIIPRGVDLEKFSFISPSARRGKVFRAGMICRFTPLKGHLDFLKAISYVSRRKSNVEAVLMGDLSSAREEYIRKIKLSIRRLGIENMVKFKDSSEDVSEVMKELDVFVSANREQEAFGRSIIEAAARGVPVVATRVGGVVENISDGVTGLLCEPADPSGMSEKILRYAEDPAFAEKVAGNARKYVEENFSLDNMLGKTLATYSRVLSDKNILIFKISSLGDIILSVPSLRAIRERFRGANIKILVDVRFRELLDNCPYVDEVITCDLRGRDRGAGFFALAGKLRSEDFDISIDLQNNRKSHLLAALAAVPERYGYDNGKCGFLLNRRISLPTRPVGPIEHQAYILGLLGITAFDRTLELWATDTSDAWAEKFLNSNWVKKGQKLVAMTLSASQRWKTKRWEMKAMVHLADMLAKERGIRVILLGTEEDRAEAAEFIRSTAAKPIDAVGKTGITQLCSLIGRCDALVTGDSAPMHIAAAAGTPFVALFGPTDPLRHIPPAGKHKVVRKKMKCMPCYKPTCLKEGKCMTSIRPSEVYEALLEVMGEGGAGSLASGI
ncbi:MAG: lipopolysaccharide heptosyltransferase II [Candidatus Omnitrophota bacterium]